MPPFFCDPHVQADVLPFIRAAQMDGNPVDGGVLNIDLSGPIMHFGYYLQQYFEARPIVANAKPALANNTCPQE